MPSQLLMFVLPETWHQTGLRNVFEIRLDIFEEGPRIIKWVYRDMPDCTFQIYDTKNMLWLKCTRPTMTHCRQVYSPVFLLKTTFLFRNTLQNTSDFAGTCCYEWKTAKTGTRVPDPLQGQFCFSSILLGSGMPRGGGACSQPPWFWITVLTKPLEINVT